MHSVDLLTHGFGPVGSDESLRRALLAAFCRPDQERPDLSLRDLAILLDLGAVATGRSLAAVAAAVGLPRESVRRGVALLERCGYATRLIETTGRREARITATPEGLRLLRDLAGGLRSAG